MFSFHPVGSSHEKRKILENLNPETDSILVADLRSKFEWQNHYLEKYPAIAEEFIFRPQDLWKKLSHYAVPEFQILSNEYVSSYLSSLISRREESFLKSPSAAKTLFAYMTQLSFVFEHPEGRDLLKEWFKENIEAFHRWGHWFFVAEEMWLSLKEEKKIPVSCLPAVLLNYIDDLEMIWKRKLYLDLSLEMKFVEAELFAKIAEHNEVHLIFPSIQANETYGMEFSSYAPFEKFSYQNKDIDSYLKGLKYCESAKAEIVRAKRFTSALSEVKDCIHSVRKLLEASVPPEKIAIVAGDIGEYWPVLRNYLQKEGVPCSRPYNTGFQSLLSVSQWLSKLKLSMRNWQKEDLEISIYRSEENLLPYKKFQVLYSKIYGDEDLSRAKAVYESFESLRMNSKNQELKRDDFLLWALQHWPSKSFPAGLEQVTKQFLVDCPGDQLLRLQDWLSYLAGVISKIEISIQPGNKEGIACLDISSLDYVDLEHIFVLGLNENSLKKNSPLKAINTSDLLSIRANTGFPLSPEESRSFEYYLLWNQHNKDRRFYYSYASTDFLGALSAPNLLWMDAKTEKKEATQNIDSPATSRLDALQQQSLDLLHEKLGGFSKQGIERDLGSYLPSPRKIQNFSAGGFKDFVQCPFKFAARYFLNLRSSPAVDLDMDRMKNGNIIHRMFELAVSNSLQADDENGIYGLVDRCLLEAQQDGSPLYFLERYRTQYIKILKKFLDFEEQWKKDFPATSYYEQEYLLDVYWDKENKKFSKENHGGPRFRAIVDRIDRKNKQLAIIDYKNSGASYRNFSSWFQEEDFQLLFYSKVLRDILQEEGMDVYAAIYYSVRPFERSKGFVRKDADLDFLPSQSRKRNLIEAAELSEAEASLTDLMLDFQEKVEQKGELFPVPSKPEEYCPKCDWKHLCRAKHLNF
ncbi:MAG: PD-(D/E)XK nuclease family protein [Bdellovibrionota bacterium]